MPLFNVPAALVKILDRDLAAAGIKKRDDRGRTVDVHAMRATFATHLAAAGVAPLVAQRAMRHSSLALTMKHYIDPRLLDVAGAVARLPDMRPTTSACEGGRATGTDGVIPPLWSVAPTVAPTLAQRGPNEAVWVNSDDEGVPGDETRNVKNRPETRTISPKTEVPPAGLEPATFSFGG